MAIQLFQPTYRTIQNPVNLDVLASTYNTLENKHQQAVESTAAFITALSDLPVNESERGYIQNHINTVQSAFDASKVYGNAAGFLDDIKLLASKIASDPGLKARMKAQADYKAYTENLDKRTDISEADKEYFRAVNTYRYEDILDKNGNVIGGTEWKPQDREVAAPDVVKYMTQAMAMVAKEGGKTSTVYYKDKNGKYVTNPALSVDNLPYYSVQGQFERMPKEKLREALNTVIANTDGAIEGLQQDFKIAKWRHNKNEGLSIDETTDDKGLPLTFDQYLDKRFNGFYHTASYSRYYEGGITPLAGMQMEIARAKAGTKSGSGSASKTAKNWKSLLDLTPTTQGGYTTTRSNAISATVAGYTAAAETLKGMADRMDVEWNPDDIQGSYDNLVNKFGANLPKEVYDAYKKYQANINKFKQIIPENHPNTQAIVFGSNLLAGVDMSQLKGNSYADAYNKLSADIYKNGKLVIPVQDTSNKKVQDIDYKSLGLELKYDNNGGMYFESDISDAANLYRIANETKPFRKIIPQQYMPGEHIPTYYRDDSYNQLDRVLNLYNESTKTVQSVMNEQTYVPLEVVPDTDLTETIAARMYSTGTFSDMENARKYVSSAINKSIANIYGPSAGFSIGWGNNPVDDDLTTDQQKAIGQIIKLAAMQYKNAPSMFSIGYDKSTGNSVINISLDDEFKKSDTLNAYLNQVGIDADDITIVATNLWNNEIKNEILNTPEYAIASEFSTDVYSGVSSWDLENGGRIVRDGDNYYNEYNGMYYPLGGFNEGKAALAANSLMSNLKYTDLIEKFKGTVYTQNDINTLATVIARDIFPNYFPGIEPSSSEGLVLINDIINSIINQN